MTNPSLFNAHLEGDDFYWKGGETGALLIHGLTATTAEVQPFAKKLHALGYTVAGPLLPGHGTTPDDLNHTKRTAWIQAAEDVYERLCQQCKTILVAGESAGAVVSLALAARHPEIKLLMLYAPAIKLNISKRREIFLRMLSPFVKSIPKGSLDASKNWQGYTVNPLKGAIQLLKLQNEVMQLLPGIKQPVLVVQGRHDTTIDPRAGEIILSRIGSKFKELHWFENSSHVVLIDCELDEITALSLEFIHRYLPEG